MCEGENWIMLSRDAECIESKRKIVRMAWEEKDGKHSLRVTKGGKPAGSATIENYTPSHMDIVIIRDSNGVPFNGYAQTSRNLNDVKRYAEESIRYNLKNSTN